MVTDNFVIFRNYSIRGYWELSGLLYTTYMSHELIKEENRGGIGIMLRLHGLRDIDSITETLIRYTKDPQEDMFIVNI